MPDREFIHSTIDVTSTLSVALDSGLQVMLDEPQSEPKPYIVQREELGILTGGVFSLFLPEWVFGPFQIWPISGGHNAGKFSISPRTNYASLTLYFSGERIIEGRRRFGSCCVSLHRDWLEMPAQVLRPMPPEVEQWFKRIVAHLSSGIVIKAGVHKYRVARGVLEDPEAVNCLPPFDFIPWSSDLLKTK